MTVDAFAAFIKCINSANATIDAMRVAPTPKFNRDMADSRADVLARPNGKVHREPIIAMHKLTRLLVRKNQLDAAHEVHEIVCAYQSMCVCDHLEQFDLMETWNQSVISEMTSTRYSAADLVGSIAALLDRDIATRNERIETDKTVMAQCVFLRDPKNTVDQLVAFGKLNNIDLSDMAAVCGTADGVGLSRIAQAEFSLSRHVMARAKTTEIQQRVRALDLTTRL